MMETLREWYFAAGDWALLGASIICGFWGVFAIMGGLSVISKARKPYNDEPTTAYPNHVFYCGAYYARVKDTAPMKYMPKWISIYAVFVILAAVMEKIVEGDVGIYARLEIWSVVGAGLGLIVFVIPCTLAGYIYGNFVAAIKNKPHGTLIVMNYVVWGIMIGQFMGIITGMVVVCSCIAGWHGLGGWVLLMALVVPVIIFIVEFAIKFSEYKNIIGFQKNLIKKYGDLPIYLCPDKSSYPPIVKPMTEEEYRE